MKILFVNTLYYPNIIGGAEKSLQILAESLVEEGHQGVVVSISPGKQVEVRDVNGVKVYYVPLKNLYWPFDDAKPSVLKKLLWHTIDTLNPWMSQELGKIMDAEAPDILHTNNLMGFSTLVWKLARERGIRVVHTLREYSLLCVRGIMFKNEQNCTNQCLECKPFVSPRKNLSQLVDAVVGISQSILDRHLKFGYFSQTQIQKVIFNPYPLKLNGTSNIISLDKKHPLRLGFLGRLTPEKGIEFLLKTLMQLPHADWELWVGGKGTIDYEQYLSNSYSMSNVRLLGFIKPEELFQNINLLVVPSLWDEPLGRTVFEAYAHGIPVIGSSRGGIPEIIDEGKTGFIFNPDDQPQQLSRTLQQVAQEPNLLSLMSQYCNKKAKVFAPEKIVKEYLEVYHNL